MLQTVEGGSHAEPCWSLWWDVPVHFGELCKLFDFYRLLFSLTLINICSFTFSFSAFDLFSDIFVCFIFFLALVG